MFRVRDDHDDGQSDYKTTYLGNDDPITHRHAYSDHNQEIKTPGDLA